jgi:hypothetical protein
MTNRWPFTALAIGLSLAALTPSAPGLAAEPLHRQIDRLIESKSDGEPAPPATDAEFARRVWLDLAGMIPPASDAREFLDDPSPYKRSRLVDRLLASPEYVRRMQQVFDVMLMERRGDVHVPAENWQAFLRQAFAENVPYDRMVAGILSSDGSDRSNRAPAKFYLDRLAEPNLVTRDVGRIFLGRDMQCAQCHDHPLVDDYKQADYYGLYAYLSRSILFDSGSAGFVLAEKAEGDVTFSSVFKRKVTHRTGPRILGGPIAPEPAIAPGAEYLLAPDKQNRARPIPRHSRRAGLAPALTSNSVPEFSRNIVNRLWAMLMGRGLVHPLDMLHGANPPSHPELLDLLSREFVAMNYDIKHFLRELAMSRAYERSSEAADGHGSADPGAESVSLAIGPMKALSPEQLGLSVMQAVGLVTAARARAETRLDGKDPRMRAILAVDPKRLALRRALIEELAYDELKGGVAAFVSQFAPAAGQPQDSSQSTVHQALFLANGGLLQSWLNSAPDHLIGKLAAMTDASNIAEELYLSLYTRRPTIEERAEVAAYLAERGKDRVPALQELAWALLTSTEFRFNH